MIDADRAPARSVGQVSHDRTEIEITVGDVKGDGAISADVAAIDVHRLLGEQMHRYRVTGEGVDRKQIQFQRPGTLEQQPAVADFDTHAARGVAEEGKVLPRQALDGRVDLEESIVVAGNRIGRQCSDPEPDHADTLRRARIQKPQLGKRTRYPKDE